MTGAFPGHLSLADLHLKASQNACIGYTETEIHKCSSQEVTQLCDHTLDDVSSLLFAQIF